MRIMTYIDAIAGEFDVWRNVEGQTKVSFTHVKDVSRRIVCPSTGQPLVLKDGWNYVCRACGRTRSGQDSGEFVCDAVRPT